MRINSPHFISKYPLFYRGGKLGTRKNVIAACFGKPKEYLLSTYCVHHAMVGLQVTYF